MKHLLQHLASVVDVTKNPLFVERPVANVAVIVVTADRGLCGAFNANLIKAAAHHVRTTHGALHATGNVRLVTVGRKGFDFFSKNGFAIANKHVGIFAGLQFGNAQTIVAEAVQGFLDGTYDRVDVVYNEFKSIAQQRIMIDQLLPIPSLDGAEAAKSQTDYIYEPSSEAIVEALVPKHRAPGWPPWRTRPRTRRTSSGRSSSPTTRPARRRSRRSSSRSSAAPRPSRRPADPLPIAPVAGRGGPAPSLFRSFGRRRGSRFTRFSRAHAG
jgi:hypothetical protein